MTINVSVVSGAVDRWQDRIFDPTPVAEVLDVAHFCGREWLIERLDAAVAAQDRGYVVVQSEAGIGKSALAAHLVWTRPCAHHFTMLEGGRDPIEARKSLAAQMIGWWNLADQFCPGGSLPPVADRPDWLSKVLHAAATARDTHRPGAPLVLVVDGLDEAEPPAPGQDTHVPLGLPRPEHLPAGVHVVATTRYGPALPGLRDHTRWEVIDVDASINIDDLCTYLQQRLNWDEKLHKALVAKGIDHGWFVDTLVERCGGVWIYARYVLDEVREGRVPVDVAALPAGLEGFYLEQIRRWSCQPDWDILGRQCLAMLAALLRPADHRELGDLLQLPDQARSSLRRWLDHILRAFLATSSSGDRRRYVIRHQSLRDLFTYCGDGLVPEQDAGLREELRDCIREAHNRIVRAWRPAFGGWAEVEGYARAWLPFHAQAAGQLDALVTDPSFLLAVDPAALLRHSRDGSESTARQAISAFEMAIGYWADRDDQQQLAWLHVNAVKTHCRPLADHTAQLIKGRWLLRATTWSGHAHRSLVHKTSVSALCAVEVDGRSLLASGGSQGGLQLWDPHTGTQVGNPWIGHWDWIQGLCVVEVDGRSLVVSAGEDQTIRLWDPRTGTQIGDPWTGHGETIDALCVVEVDGRQLVASGSADETVRLWDPRTGTQIGAPWKAGEVCALCVVEVNGRQLVASGCRRGMVRLWDPRTGREVRGPWTGHTNMIFALCVVEVDGWQLVASGGFDETVRLWDPRTGTQVRDPWTGHTGGIQALCAVQVDGQQLVASGGDETVRLWALRTGTPAFDGETGHIARINALCAVEVDGQQLVASGSDDKTVRLWDPRTGTQIGEPWTGHTNPINILCAVQVDGQQLVASRSANDNAVLLWDPRTGTRVGGPWTGHRDSIYTLCSVQVDGQQLLASAHITDSSVRLWGPRTGTQIGEPWTGHHRPVRALCAVQMDGRQLVASGSFDETVRLWDPRTGTQIGDPWTGHTGMIRALCAVQVDGQQLVASGSNDETVRLWDPRTGTQIGDPWTGHTGVVSALCAVQVDGQQLVASGSFDETVRLWDPRTGTQIGASLVGHSGWIHALYAMQVDGQPLVASGGDDRALYVWEAAESAGAR